MRSRLIVYIILICLQGVNAQVPEYTRHISRSFHISTSVSVEVSNKYGRIQVIHWEKDSVRFDIDLRIKAKDNTKLGKIKQNIEFDITHGQSYILAKTRFGESGSDVLKDLVDIAGSYLSSQNSVIINYTVRMPAHLNLKIENKFGDVYLDDHAGALDLVLSYGDLKANRLIGRSDLKVTSGDADINYLKEATVIFSYVNARVNESSMLNLQSQSSVLNLEKAGNLKLNSRRDKIFLMEGNFISGETYFSLLNIGTLNNSVSLAGRYGDVIIGNIRRTFTSLNLTSELTDIFLTFEKAMAFDFDLIHHQAVLFSYPSSLANLSTSIVNAEQKLSETTGYFGTSSSPSKVSVKAVRKCNLTISQR